MPATKPTTRSKQQTASKTPQAAPNDASEGLLDEGDIGLIRTMLNRTPTERLERLQDFADGIMALRNGRVYRQ